MSKLPAVISYLEMTMQPELEPNGLQILRASPFAPWYFLALYRAVGGDYHWVDMLELDDEALKAYCDDPNKTLFTLIDDGQPAGFFVLNEMGAITDLAYFGLAPQAMGKNLGGRLLESAIMEAWKNPLLEKMTVNTCTLDHPRALPLYLSRGFVIVRKEDFSV